MIAQAEQLGPATLTRFAEIVHTGLIDMRGATAPRLLLELLCARMLLPGAVPTDAVADSAVLQRLERIERGVAAGQLSAVPAAPPAASRPAAPPAAPPAATETGTAGRAPVAEPPAAAVRAPAASPAAARSTDWPATAPAAPPPAAEGDAPTGDAAPADTPASAPAASGTIDAAGLRRLWSDLLAAVRKNSRSTEAMLTNAMVQSVEGDTVVIAHPAAPLARRLAEPRNADAIAKALGEVLPGQWHVKCVHATQNAAATQSVAAKPRTDPPTFKRPTQPAEPAPEPPRAAPAPPPPATVPSADEPPPPEPPDDDYFEDAPPAPVEEAPRDPEADVVKLLTDKLGARAIDR
jgi:DNA polymerase-3 subunit gamma/tau